MEQLLEQFFEHLRYERNASEHTRREFDIRQIDHITIREWLAALHAANKAKTSIARKLASLRTFFQFLLREGVVASNPAKLVSTPRLEKKLPTHLTVEDAVRFIETPDTQTDLGKRDRTILEMLYGTGVRVSELTKLNLRDVDFKNRMVKVTGKRRKQRVVPFGEPALHALVDYLQVRATFLNSAPATERDEQALFLNYQGTR